jgi:hypothetical protein
MNHSFTTQVLDANISFHVELTTPRFGIPLDNRMWIHVDIGNIIGVCTTPGHGYGNTMIQAQFYNISGWAHMNYNGNPNNPGLIVVIDQWIMDTLNVTLIVPRLLWDKSMLNDWNRRGLNMSTDWWNAYSEAHPFVLPEPMRPLIPHPVVTIRHQPGCCESLHGYIEVVSSCSCDESASSIWPSCSPKLCNSHFPIRNTTRTSPISILHSNDHGGNGGDEPMDANTVGVVTTTTNQEGQQAEIRIKLHSKKKIKKPSWSTRMKRWIIMTMTITTITYPSI